MYLGNNPLERYSNIQQQAPNYVQSIAPVQNSAPAALPAIAPPMMPAAPVAAAEMGTQAEQIGLPAPGQGALSVLGQAAAPAVANNMLASTAGTAAVAAMGPMGFLAAPLLGAGLSMLFNDGTAHVPEINYGQDPLMGYNMGTNSAGMNPDVVINGQFMSQHTPEILGVQGYNRGGYAQAMQYAQGIDSVPAMLTPGEAIIPAGAAQDPMNQGAIQGMINQGQAMNRGMPAQSPMGDQSHQMPSGEMMPGESHGSLEDAMMGPLSGKAKRENMKSLQDLSLTKKSWLAEEQRKQESHDQKMRLTASKAKQAMSEG